MDATCCLVGAEFLQSLGCLRRKLTARLCVCARLCVRACFRIRGAVFFSTIHIHGVVLS